MSDRIDQFTEFRKRMNDRILEQENQVVRRFFALDTQTYKDGALPLKTKEMLGLVASLVLRCDDCVSYHVAQCREAGVNPNLVRAPLHRVTLTISGRRQRVKLVMNSSLRVSWPR